DIESPYSEHTWDIFRGMKWKWYHTYSIRMIPGGAMLMTFDVPEGRDQDFDDLVEGMRQIGFVKRAQDDPGFDWKRNNCMRAERFDFKRSSGNSTGPSCPQPLRRLSQKLEG